jgi:hypothetical protein
MTVEKSMHVPGYEMPGSDSANSMIAASSAWNDNMKSWKARECKCEKVDKAPQPDCNYSWHFLEFVADGR